MLKLVGVTLRLLAATSLLCALSPIVVGTQESARDTRSRTLLAVFAHPDDEASVGPLLARYARDPQTRVVLAIVTNGDKGVRPFANIPAGAPLAAARAKEAQCACEALGAQPPILLGLPDDALGSRQVLPEAREKVGRMLAEVRPDAIVTWGPDGGSGHPDHRLVSALVTEIVQSGDATPLLYYVGLPKSRVESAAGKSSPSPFATVMDDALDTRVAYTAEDAERARKSLACHRSQFTPEDMEMIGGLLQQVHQGRMHLRRWSGGGPRTDLFDR